MVELQSLTFPLVKMDVFLKSNEQVHSLILYHGAIVEKEPIYSRWIHPNLTLPSSEVFGSQVSFCVLCYTVNMTLFNAINHFTRKHRSHPHPHCEPHFEL